MTKTPSRSICLFGTEEPVEAPIILKAGPLSAEFEAGNLRYVRFHGVEMIRALSYIVRDRDWGTYNPRIRNLKIVTSSDHFHVSYDAEAGDATQNMRYSAVITGDSTGALRFEGNADVVTDFVTNRTGFVVLHPIEDVAGHHVMIEHVDGRHVETLFPKLIDPIQPMMELRAITHNFGQGAKVRCLMEGDTFEMEDQRNWTDASYKTYVRPLALPWPYTLAKGTKFSQAVSLSVEGQPSHGGAGTDVSIPIVVKPGKFKAPALGFGLDPDDCESVLTHIDMARPLAPQHLICHYDPRRGHSAETLKQQLAIARELHAEPWLEAVITRVDGWQDEISALGSVVGTLGNPFHLVMLSPASDLKCTLPGTTWPPCPPAEDLFRHARTYFPKAKLVGGMFSYFTELNRKRPPLDVMDSVSFTTSALVHAGDDRSVTESLEALPHIARSVRAIVGDTPYAVGPSAIGMRDNPYGAKTMDNPESIRQAMNWNDPRQQSLLGAAWNVGYFAHFAQGGARSIALGGITGPFGLLSTPQNWKQAWFDQNRGLYPSYHVMRVLSSFADANLCEVAIGTPRDVQMIAVQRNGGIEALVANLTGTQQKIELSGFDGSIANAILDASTFAAASQNLSFLSETSNKLVGRSIILDAYAVMHLKSA